MRRKAKKESVEAGAPDFAMLNVKELEAFLKIDQKTIYRYVSLGADSLCSHSVKHTLREAPNRRLD